MRSFTLVVLGLCACTGSINTSVPLEPVCAEAPRLARLSGVQYRAVIDALMADGGAPARLEVPFAQARRTDLFSTWAGQASLSEYEVDDVWRASELVANAWLAENPDTCAGAERTPACLRRVFGRALTVLWSRPPSDDDLVGLGEALSDAEHDLTPDQAVAATVRRVLMSPRFLFRSEVGVDGPLDSHEVAAALAFTLTDRPPDALLREAAETTGLTDPELVAGQARRLLERPAAVPMLRRFLRELLQYDGAPAVPKSAADAPFHHPAELVDDTDQVVDSLVTDHARSGLLRALLTTDLAYVRPSTSTSWGIDAHSDAGVFVHDPSRTGVLTHPAWLVAMSQADHNHLVRRGRFIRERLLCDQVPMLPGGVVPQIQDAPGLTLRQRTEQHSKNPACAGCHTLMDPLAMGFEAWDHLGRPQKTDNGGAVVTSGTLSGGGSEVDGPYGDAHELMTRLADSQVVRACWVKLVFRYVRGREVAQSDACELEQLTALYERSGEDTLAVIEAMFTAPGFLHRKRVSQ